MAASSTLRRFVSRGLALAAAGAVIWYLASNIAANLDERGLGIGFGFLREPAGFDIGDKAWLDFTPADTFGRAILIGIINTARVAAIGCALALLAGFALGLTRLSNNPALRRLVTWWVDLVRGTPLLLLLLLIAALVHSLPDASHAYHPLPGVFLSDRGLLFPTFTSTPKLVGYNFVGGVTLSPEFAALVLALVLHQSAHISEVVRGAILAVPRGQIDAARGLGLSRLQTLRLITIPLALRAMIPLLASNCVSLIKNSSLAVAIGFPDVVSVLNTTGNQTGHSIETMLLMIATYLTLSLIVAAALGRHNARLLRR